MSLPDWNPSWSETSWDQTLNGRLYDFEFDILSSVPRSALENLALDAMLFSRVAQGQRRPVIRFWDWNESAVILGSFQSVQNEMDSDFARQNGFTFARRISGGGAMVVEPGKSITYSIILPEPVLSGLSFIQSFAFLDMWCVRALRGLGIPASYKPINDIASAAGKIGGAAQYRRKKTVLHHTAMAYDLDNELMSRILRHGQPRGNTKGIPSAVKIVSPLREFTQLTQAQLMDYLFSTAQQAFRTKTSSLQPDELVEVQERMRSLSSEEWLYRVQ